MFPRPRALLVFAILAVIVAASLFARPAIPTGAQGGTTGSAMSQLAMAMPSFAAPDMVANLDHWPASNYDLYNSRNVRTSGINSSNAGRLHLKWRFLLKGAGTFGVMAASPIIIGNAAYVQDLQSNVYAINKNTGHVLWTHMFNEASVGPNGLTFGYGHLYGATGRKAFAMNPLNGHVLWQRGLIRNKFEGVDMAPQVFNNMVIVSSVPGNANAFYGGRGQGIVYALNAATGRTIWHFNTIKGGYLWGHPKVNSGGGLWYSPAVDPSGRLFLGVANPAPFPGTKQFPNGSSHPGPNLYTDSLVALDSRTGKLLWYRQGVRHDHRDYDEMIGPILAWIPVNGVTTEVVFSAGKMGRVWAYRADNGQQLWTQQVGRHQNDLGNLPRNRFVLVCPGILGGVETPMAFSQGRLFVPWLNACFMMNATSLKFNFASFATDTGGLTAFDGATGRKLWVHRLPSMDFGGATVANDVVFTSTYAGNFYALRATNGQTLWKFKARAGINSTPAIDGNLVIVGAAATGLTKKPIFELLAFQLR